MAMPRPIPRLAPVTTATVLVSGMVCSLSAAVRRRRLRPWSRGFIAGEGYRYVACPSRRGAEGPLVRKVLRMKIGVISPLSRRTPDPATMARACEDRGFESFFVGE